MSLPADGAVPPGLAMQLTGLVPEGQLMVRSDVFSGLTSSLPRDPDAKVWVYTFELLPGGYTMPHAHNGATFFLLMQGEFEAHFDDGHVFRAKAGDLYSEPIGKVHRGYNPHPEIPAAGVSFNFTSPDRDHITTVPAMDNDPVTLHGWG